MMTKRSIVQLKIQLTAAIIIMASLVGCGKININGFNGINFNGFNGGKPISPVSKGGDEDDSGSEIDTNDRPLPPGVTGELTTQADLFKKVVIKTNGVVVYEYPGKNKKANVEVKYFDIFYEFGRTEANGKKYVCVSSSPKYEDKIGYVAEEDVVDWSSRVGFVPPPYSLTRSNLIQLFATFEDAKARHEGEDVEPIGVYEAKKNQIVPKLPWLISDKKTLDERTVAYKVYGLGKIDENKVKAYNDSEIEKLQKAVRRLDVVFFIDGTGSMRKPIDEVKEGVKQIAESLRSLKEKDDVDVKFGLVVYRDVYRDKKKTQRDEHMYEFYDLDDLEKFVSQLGKIKATGGGDDEERGYQALQDAINQTTWRESSVRSLIVVGDAQWHKDGESNPDRIGNKEIANLAQEKRVSIDVIAVKSKKLADQLSSLARQTNGETRLFKDEEKDKLAEDISKKLGERAEEIKINGDVLDGLAEGKDMEILAKETGKTPEEIVNVFHVLQTQGVELERLKKLEAGEAVLVQGWIVVDKSAPLEVFLYRFEADLVKGSLGALRESRGNATERYNKTVSIAFNTRVQDKETDSESSTNSRFTYERSGLPYGSDSILRYTTDDIRSMSDAQRSELFDKIELKLEEFNGYCNDASRWNQSNVERTGWIPENAFP